MLYWWLRNPSCAHRSGSGSRSGLAARLYLEPLETRDLPAVITPFAPRFSVTDNGDIALVANTLMTATGSGATDAQNGVGSDLSNNDFAMGYVDVDANATTFNSSQATLALPAGSTVLWAGLYWGAQSTNAARAQVLFTTPGASGYSTLQGAVVGASGSNYHAFLDVTGLVQAAGNGVYGVANVQANTGTNTYAGWSLVVVYRDPSVIARNLTVFDGYAAVTSTDDVTLALSGFVAPPNGDVTARVGIVAYEGDLALTGDALQLNGTTLSNGANPANNLFNSTISSTTGRNPNYVNQLGYDSDAIDTINLIANGATSATLMLTSSGDVYLPGVVTTAIDTVNGAPTTADDTFTIPAGSGTTFLDVLANDTDEDNDPLTVSDVTPASHGDIAIAVAGAGVVYTPDPGYSGADSFTYTASDGRGGFTTGTVNLNVLAANVPPVNLPPVINPDLFRVPFGSGRVFLDPLANDFDPEGAPLTILSAFTAGGGSVAVGGGGLFYTPGFNFTGADLVTYTVTDGSGAVITAAFQVEIFEQSGGPFNGLVGNAFAVVGNPIALLPLSDPGATSAPSLPGRQLAFIELGGEVIVAQFAQPGGTAEEDDPTRGEISGLVFYDRLNGNGKRDEGEAALQNQPVALYAKQGNGYVRIGQTATDQRGVYRFRGLKPGMYRVNFQRPDGVEVTWPGDEGYTEEVVQGARSAKRDFGIKVKAGFDGDPLRGVPAAIEITEDNTNPRPTPEKPPSKPQPPLTNPDGGSKGARLDLSSYLMRAVAGGPAVVLAAQPKE